LGSDKLFAVANRLISEHPHLTREQAASLAAAILGQRDVLADAGGAASFCDPQLGETPTATGVAGARPIGGQPCIQQIMPWPVFLAITLLLLQAVAGILMAVLGAGATALLLMGFAAWSAGDSGKPLPNDFGTTVATAAGTVLAIGAVYMILTACLGVRLRRHRRRVTWAAACLLQTAQCIGTVVADLMGHSGFGAFVVASVAAPAAVVACLLSSQARSFHLGQG